MKKTVRILLTVVCLLVVVALGLIVWAIAVGIPSPLVRHYLERIEGEQGVRIAVGRVRWMPWHHVTASDIRLSTPGNETHADFREVVVNVEPRQDADTTGRSVRCRFSEGTVAFADGEKPLRSARLLEGDVWIDAGRRTRIRATGTVEDHSHFTVEGTVRPAPAAKPDAPRPTAGKRLAALAERVHPLLEALAQRREKGILPERVDARVTFDVQAGDASRNRARAWVEGGPLRIGRMRFKQVSASMLWTNGQLRVERLTAESPESELRMEGAGSLVVGTGEVDSTLRIQAPPSALWDTGLLPTNHAAVAQRFAPVDLHLDLSGNWRRPAGAAMDFLVTGPEAHGADPGLAVKHGYGTYSNGILHVRSLSVTATDPGAGLPARWAAPLTRVGLRLDGPLSADVSLGPAPITNLLGDIGGRLTCEAAEYRGAALEQIALTFRRRQDQLWLSDATARLQDEDAVRTVSAEGTVLPGSGYRIQLRTDAEPQRLAAFLPTNIAAFAASFGVNGDSWTEATLAQDAPGQTNLTLRARVHATDVVRNGAAVDLLHASLAYRHGMLQVEDLALVRPDGQVTGRIEYDIATQRLSLEGRTTAPPVETARFIGPGLERILSAFHLEGPTTIAGKGTLGLGRNTSRDLRLQVKIERLGWRWFLADRAELDLVLSDQATSIENARARWCEGDVAGSMRLERGGTTNAGGRCSMDLVLDGADLASVIDVFRDLEDRTDYTGTLSGQLALAGPTGSNFLHTATGSGRLGIRDGYVLSLPVFGGLSKYLSVMIPGLGYASQRELQSTFRIGDGALQTEDAQLLGRLITIQGKGAYAFNGDLKFRVQVLFLKEGLTATVTRLLTSPLTKALEFELTGTAREPHWRPLNTPDRLLKFFKEKLGGVLPFGDGAKKEPAPPARQP